MARRLLRQPTIVVLILSVISAGQSSWEGKNLAGEKAFQEGRLLGREPRFSPTPCETPSSSVLTTCGSRPSITTWPWSPSFRTTSSPQRLLYEKAIAVMEAQGQENPLLLPVLDNLTSLYVKQWAFGKAIQTSWRACHIREKKFGPDKPGDR